MSHSYHPYPQPRTKQTARKSTGSEAPRPRKEPKCPAWVPPSVGWGTSPRTKAKAEEKKKGVVDGVLMLRMGQDGGCQATWSEAEYGQCLVVPWHAMLTRTMTTFMEMTGVQVASVMRPYWFENIDGEGYHDDVDMEDVMGDEDGWVRVVIKTAKGSKGPRGGKGAGDKAKAKTEDKPKAQAKSVPKTARSNIEEHAISFQDSEGKCLVRWGQCKLVLPWTHSFEDVARAFAGLLGIKVGRGRAFGFVSADEDELDGSAELRDVMSDMSDEGSWGAARTVVVSIKTA